jgi:hypothetical protein
VSEKTLTHGVSKLAAASGWISLLAGGYASRLWELSAQAITAFDMEMKFKTMAAIGNSQQALAILDRLDEQESIPTVALDREERVIHLGDLGTQALPAALDHPCRPTPR